jgi:hypothetical protein
MSIQESEVFGLLFVSLEPESLDELELSELELEAESLELDLSPELDESPEPVSFALRPPRP